MKDYLGREIQVGDWVSFPGRSGSSLWTTVMKVTEIQPPGRNARLYGVQTNGARTYTSIPERAVILRAPEE